MSRADLSLQNLIGKSYQLFNLRPFTCCSMWIVYAMLQNDGTRGSRKADIEALPEINPEFADVDPEFLATIAMISTVWMTIGVFLGPALKGGYQHTALRMLRGDNNVGLVTVLSGFDKYIKLLAASLIYTFLFVLGIFLLVVPGIIVSLGLWPVFLIIMEKNCSLSEAFKESWLLTTGYKMQMFVYGICAAIMYLLGLLLCCVGVLFTGPIADMGFVVAYDELRKAQAKNKIDLS